MFLSVWTMAVTETTFFQKLRMSMPSNHCYYTVGNKKISKNYTLHKILLYLSPTFITGV